MRTKLTEEQVTEIFSYRWENKETSDSPLIGKCHVLAKRYKVSPKAIRDIWNMRTWTHVTHVGSGAPKESAEGNLHAVAEEEDDKIEEEHTQPAADRQDKGCSPISFHHEKSSDTKNDSKKSAAFGVGSMAKEGVESMGQAQAIREMLRQQMADTEVVPNLDFGTGLHSTLHDVPTPPSSLNAVDLASHRLAAHDLGLGKRARPDMMQMDLRAGLNASSQPSSMRAADLDLHKRARPSPAGLPLGLKTSPLSHQTDLQKLLPNMPLGMPRNDANKNLDTNVLESLARMNMQQNFERQHSASALSRMGTMTSLPVQPGSGISGPLSAGGLSSAQSVTASNIAMLQQLVNSVHSSAAASKAAMQPRGPNLIAHLQALPPNQPLSGGSQGPLSGGAQGMPSGPEAWRSGVAGLR